MKLIAQKPCSFGGRKFYIDDEIPVEYVLDPKLQQKQGVLKIVPDSKIEEIKDAPITLYIRAEEGDVEVQLSSDGLQAVFDVLSANVENGTAIIEQMTDKQALLMLNVTDSRKGIKDAAEARAKALSQEAGDQ